MQVPGDTPPDGRLDVTGTIPDPAEVRTFLDDRRADKRADKLSDDAHNNVDRADKSDLRDQRYVKLRARHDEEQWDQEAEADRLDAHLEGRCLRALG